MTLIKLPPQVIQIKNDSVGVTTDRNKIMTTTSTMVTNLVSKIKSNKTTESVLIKTSKMSSNTMPNHKRVTLEENVSTSKSILQSSKRPIKTTAKNIKMSTSVNEVNKNIIMETVQNCGSTNVTVFVKILQNLKEEYNNLKIFIESGLLPFFIIIVAIIGVILIVVLASAVIFKCMGHELVNIMTVQSQAPKFDNVSSQESFEDEKVLNYVLPLIFLRLRKLSC